MPGALLWGYYLATKTWIPLQVDTNGYVKVDMSNINLEDLANVYPGMLMGGEALIWDGVDMRWEAKFPIATQIRDIDLDTGVYAERFADEDKIRMRVKAVEAFLLSDAGILTLPKQSMAAGRQTSDQTIPTGKYTPLFFDTEETDIQGEMDLASGQGTAEAGTTGTTLHDAGVFAGAQAGDHIWNTIDHTYWVIASVTSDDEVETTAAHDIAVGETFTWFRAKYTVTEDGTYLIVVKILLQLLADTKTGLAAIYVDGVNVMIGAMFCSADNSYPGPVAITMVKLTAGQVVEGYIYHNHGSDRLTRGLTNYDTRYNIIKLG